MRWAALATWIVAIDGGLILLGFWLRAGGLRRRHRKGPRIGPELIVVHFSLAATALTLWIVYLSRGGAAWAVAALCVLVVVATIGFTMFGIWLVHRLMPAPPAGPSAPPRRVDQRLPVVVIVLHGVFAAATLFLVALVVATGA
jgi:hypothetical protein